MITATSTNKIIDKNDILTKELKGKYLNAKFYHRFFTKMRLRYIEKEKLTVLNFNASQIKR